MRAKSLAVRRRGTCWVQLRLRVRLRRLPILTLRLMDGCSPQTEDCSMCERQICAVCKYTRSLGVLRETRRIS